MLQAGGNDAGARDLVDAYVARATTSAKTERDQAQQYLVAGRLYSSIGAHNPAEGWYRRLMELNPSAYVLVVQSLIEQQKQQEAAELILEAAKGEITPSKAIVLANVLTATGEAIEAIDETPQSKAYLADAMQKNQDNVDLLQAEAVMRASRGEYDAAIASFRKVLQLDPDNALTLNNLATLLAEKPNQRGEALERIQHAIAVAGRLPALLDTQGTIYLKLENEQQAIACLEEATAGGSVDARYYLHLAAAYRLAKRDSEALVMLNEARGFGLDKFVLTDDDRELLSTLDEELSSAMERTNTL